MDPANLDVIPVTYQAITDYFIALGEVSPFLLRKETFLRIERLTGRPLIVYVSKTSGLSPGIAAYIDDTDLTGFGDLVSSVPGSSVDVFLVSNGGSPEATERIVRLLRNRFESVRFIIPGNAYSAATLLCFSGDLVLMDELGTLGPIDPQINGIPARAILRAMEEIEKRLASEGPRALTAYLPLLEKYDLHILEICKSAQELSRELASDWLRRYMLKGASKEKVEEIVDFFSSYDVHKSHGRSIDRTKAKELLGDRVQFVEALGPVADLVRSLQNQYLLFMDKSGFFKVFENAYGIQWGRQVESIRVQIPFPNAGRPLQPQPGPPERTN